MAARISVDTHPQPQVGKQQLTRERLSPRFANAVTAVRGPHTLKALKYDKLIQQGGLVRRGGRRAGSMLGACVHSWPRRVKASPLLSPRVGVYV